MTDAQAIRDAGIRIASQATDPDLGPHRREGARIRSDLHLLVAEVCQRLDAILEALTVEADDGD